MKNKLSFRIFWIAAITLVACAVTVGFIYWQKSNTDKEFNSSAEEIAVRSVGQEIVSLRTANTETFKGSNPNELTTHIYASDKYYLDKASLVYKEIDTSTHEIPAIAKLNPFKTYDAFVDAGVYRTEWFTDKPWNYKFSVGDSWIEYEALFDESSVLDISVETSEAGVKETITLKDSTAPTKLQWNVTESIGKSAISTPPPTAVDANGKDVKVISSQNGDILTYEVDTTGAVFPIEVDPTSVIATNAGYLSSMADSCWEYATARNAVSATGYGSSRLDIGQGKSTPCVYLSRSFASFAIPNMTALTAASLFLYGRGNNSTEDFNIYILTSTYSNPLALGDFGLFNGHQAGGAYNGTILNNSWNSSSYSATWNQIVFNAAGLSAILAKKNSTFLMAAISSEDYNNSEPNYDEYIYFYPPSSAGKEPYLSLTYTGAPTVTTQAASSVTATTATGNGNITNIGLGNATTRGVEWGTSTGNYTTSVTQNGSFGTGAFTASLINLPAGTTIYARAKAYNSAGWGYGSEVTFLTTTAPTAPTVTTQAVSSINTTTATGNGNVTADGGTAITERGIVVSTSANPTTADSKFTSAGTTGAFTASITGRSAGTLYHARAYATNSSGTSYGADVEFTTISIAAPTVTTQSASSITTMAAVFNGNITAVGGTNATIRGFTYGIDPSLSTPIATTIENGSFGTGAFTGAPSSSLVCNTTYYYRAYTTNSGGTGLGNIATFTTSACPLTPINGACGATYWNCTSPATSINRVNGPNFWTWVCPGSNGGNPSPQCSEAKSIQPPTTSCSPLYLAPTHIYTQQNSSGTVTAFTRTIQAINISPTEERIISTVSWSYHGTPYSVTITDHLTPWQ